MNTLIRIGLGLMMSFSVLAQDQQTVEVGVSSMHTQREWQAQWQPLKWYPLKSPSQATLKSISVKEGQKVQAGQQLMTLSQPPLLLKLEEAKWTLEQKRLVLKEVIDWTNSPEYRRAKNDWMLQKQECERQSLKIKETQALFELGGVALDILRQEQNQWERCRVSEQQALDRFESTKSKGNPQAVLKSRLELKKAALDYKLCLKKVRSLDVKAPVEGVFYSPHVFSNQFEYAQLVPAQEIQENQWLGVIAPPEDLGAVLEVNERQLEALEQATHLELRVNGESLEAQLVSEEPLNVMNIDDSRSMKYLIKLKPLTGPSKTPRLGSHVEVVALYKSNHPPLKIPLNALHWQEGNAYVLRQNTTDWDKIEVSILEMMNGYAHVEGDLREGDTLGIAS